MKINKNHSIYSFWVQFNSKIIILLFSKPFLDGEHEEQPLQWSDQQCQQQQQQPADGATFGHTKPANASHAPDHKPTPAEPPSSAAIPTTTATTSVQT
jgi:hypothetical protein